MVKRKINFSRKNTRKNAPVQRSSRTKVPVVMLHQQHQHPHAAKRTGNLCSTIEHRFEDAFFGFLLLFSLLTCVMVLMSEGGWWIFSGQAIRTLVINIFPLLTVFIILSIGRELWALRAYADHIHVSDVMRERI